MIESGKLHGFKLKPCTRQRICPENLRGHPSLYVKRHDKRSGHLHAWAQCSIGIYAPEYGDLKDNRTFKYNEIVVDETNLVDDRVHVTEFSITRHLSAELMSKSKCGSALLCTSSAVGISFATAFGDLTGNHVFMCAFWSWLVAQVAKVFTAYYREGHWDYKVMFDSGGMPSSHTSLVVGLTTSIAHQYGLGSVYFPLALAFTLIVMYDAAGVRRHAGKQAEVLNKILADTFHGSPISNTKLKEVLGHSPLQVMCGAILGVVVGSFYMLKFSY